MVRAYAMRVSRRPCGGALVELRACLVPGQDGELAVQVLQAALQDEGVVRLVRLDGDVGVLALTVQRIRGDVASVWS